MINFGFFTLSLEMMGYQKRGKLIRIETECLILLKVWVVDWLKQIAFLDLKWV